MTPERWNLLGAILPIASPEADWDRWERRNWVSPNVPEEDHTDRSSGRLDTGERVEDCEEDRQSHRKDHSNKGRTTAPQGKTNTQKDSRGTNIPNPNKASPSLCPNPSPNHPSLPNPSLPNRARASPNRHNGSREKLLR